MKLEEIEEILVVTFTGKAKVQRVSLPDAMIETQSWKKNVYHLVVPYQFKC